MVTVEWKGGMAFEADPPSGHRFVMDASSEAGGHEKGPTPVEALISAVAACSAIDVLGILEKKRLKVDEYRIEAAWERGPVGEWPRPVTSVTVTHRLKGKDLDDDSVARAVELSDEKYCSVIATLRTSVAVESKFSIEN